MYEIDDAAHDRVRLRISQCGGNSHGQDICRNVQNDGGKEQGPGSSDTVRLSLMQWTTASRAKGNLPMRRLGPATEQVAVMAADQAELFG